MINRILIIFLLLMLSLFTSAADVQLGLTDIKPEKNAYIHNNFGLMYLDEYQYAAAIQEFKIAISLNPTSQASSVFYNNLGETYLKLQCYDIAQDCFERAINRDPHHFRYYLNLVTVYQNRGLLDTKLAQLIRHKKTPLDDITIGLIYIAKGQKSRGIALLDNFVMNEPKLYITEGVKYYLMQFSQK
ncbi:MAG: tetratricopeptide repeat protein [Candidatus Gastranaerophilaceae bacterium]